MEVEPMFEVVRKWYNPIPTVVYEKNSMTELTDELINIIEEHLDNNGIELDIKELDTIRDALDEVLGNYEEPQ